VSAIITRGETSSRTLRRVRGAIIVIARDDANIVRAASARHSESAG
jgi:hypothetical protein